MITLNLAGGYKNNAVKSETFVVFPDGKSSKNNLLFSPKIIDGSEIRVPTKEDVRAI